MTSTAADRSRYAPYFRALGVSQDASWDEVRQAYKDLVRVWHPDRFQSDPQLKKRAEQQLQKVNEAFRALKNLDIFDVPKDHFAPPPRPEPKSPPAEPDPPPASTRPSPSAPPPTSAKPSSYLPLTGLLKVALLCFLPAMCAGLLMNSLRVPRLDTDMLRAKLPAPAILEPSRIINPLADGAATARSLTSWARGESVDLWRALPKIGARPSDVPMDASPPAVAVPTISRPPAEARHRPPAAEPTAPVAPTNGMEMRWTDRIGSGQLSIANDTDKDAFAVLVQTKTSQPLRGIYVQAKHKVSLREIAVGVDDLIAELGENWNPQKRRFTSGRQSLGRSGPFEFLEVASEDGRSGRTYEIVLRAR